MRELLLARWSDIGDKIVTLAEEFPADKYDAAPAPGTRSFSEQLRHVAFWNQYAHDTLRRQPTDGSPNELPRATYPTKDKIVAALRRSFDDVRNQVANANGTLDIADLDTLVAYIEHNGEHYGQLAVYYRLNGFVPPASR